MRITQTDLKEQLVEYRKAFRAMMRFHDSSQSLSELFDKELNKLFESVDWFEVSEENEEWERPNNISLDAYQYVADGVNTWGITCYSDETLKAKKNSIYLKVYLNLDLYPTEENPADSLSAIELYAWRITDIKGKSSDVWDDLDDDSYNSTFINEDSGIDENGDILQPMPIKTFPGIWSSKEKYYGDYAVGLYDLSELINEEKVKETIITDIKNLIKKWEN